MNPLKQLDAIDGTGRNHSAGNPLALEVVGARLIESSDNATLPSALLYPSDLGAGPSTAEALLGAPLTLEFRDARRPAARAGRVQVYDAAYDDPASFKFAADCPLAVAATPAPTAAPCRTAIECALGYRGNGTLDARGCYVGELRCLPVAKTKLGVLQQDMGGYPGAVHGGKGPYVYKPALEAVLGG